MSNSREQYLMKRIQRLERQVVALDMTINRLCADLEMTESVGAAFAWDLSGDERLVEWMQERWDAAVAALEEQQRLREEVEQRGHIDPGNVLLRTLEKRQRLREKEIKFTERYHNPDFLGSK